MCTQGHSGGGCWFRARTHAHKHAGYGQLRSGTRHAPVTRPSQMINPIQYPIQIRRTRPLRLSGNPKLRRRRVVGGKERHSDCSLHLAGGGHNHDCLRRGSQQNNLISKPDTPADSQLLLGATEKTSASTRACLGGGPESARTEFCVYTL